MMNPFPDLPLEIIGEVIHALQVDMATLKVFSQSCKSLRQYIFRTISLSPLRDSITSFGRLLDRRADIAALVQNLEYEIELDHLNDHLVLRVLENLHHVQSLRLNGSGLIWNRFPPHFQKLLLRLIHSHSLTHLRIYRMWNFPVTAFLPCMNLTDLAVIELQCDPLEESYQQEYFTLGAVPQLHSFSFGRGDGPYVNDVMSAKSSDGLPIVLDFSHLRRLDVHVKHNQDVEAVKTLLQATEKLETLRYQSELMGDACRGLAASMLKFSASTVKSLHFAFFVGEYQRDHLCGLCEELNQLRGHNVIEEITLRVSIIVFSGHRYTISGAQWRQLDTSLANGFPMLRYVSADVVLKFDADWRTQLYLSSRHELNRIPEYSPLLSQNPNITFHSSTKQIYGKI